MGNMSGSYGSHYTLWQSITQNWQSVEGNYSNVTVRMYLTFDGSSYYAYTNNTTYGNMGGLGSYSIGSLNYSSEQYKDILLAEWTGNVYHENDGSKYFSVSGYWDTNTSRMGSGSCSAGVWLSTIHRNANITSLNVKSRTINSITLEYRTDRSARLYCKINGGNWLNNGQPFVSDTTSGNLTIYYKDRENTKRLDPNTSYKIEVLCRSTQSGLDTSKTITTNTLDIPKITKVENVEFGENVGMTISNLSNGQAKLIVKIGEAEICTREELDSNYSLIFSREELSNMVKQLKEETTEITYEIVTDNTYTAKTQGTITLNASAFIKKDGKWVRIKMYKKKNKWNLLKVYVKIDNVWRNTK